MIEQCRNGGAVGRWQRGEPLLFERVTFVTGKSIQALEPYQIGPGAGSEGRECLAQERGDLSAAFFEDGVARDEGGEGGGELEGFVTAPEFGVTRDESGFLHEPRAALVGALELE